MSYNIVGKFFLGDKPVITSDFSMLKNINELRYSLTLKHVDSISIPKKVEEDISKDEAFEKNGLAFNRRSFEDALIVYKNRYEELKEKSISTYKLKSSLEYYKLNDEQRERFEEDLMYNSEDLEEVEWQLFSISQIIGVFDVVESMYIDGKWNYNTDVTLYLEAH